MTGEETRWQFSTPLLFPLYEVEKLDTVVVQVEGPVPQFLRIGLCENVFTVDFRERSTTLTRLVPFAEIYAAIAASFFLHAKVVIAGEP